MWHNYNAYLLKREILVSPSLLTQFMNEGYFPWPVVCWKSFRCVAIFEDSFCRAESLPPYVHLETICFSCRLKHVWNVVREFNLCSISRLSYYTDLHFLMKVLVWNRVFLKDCSPSSCLQHVYVWLISMPMYFGCINCRVGSQTRAPKFRCQGVSSLPVLPL